MTPFKQARQAAGLSTTQLAAASRCSTHTVWSADRGYTPKSVLIREALADVLGVREDELWPTPAE
jgi:transcriptional regulator with XRE-family HTH domain